MQQTELIMRKNAGSSLSVDTSNKAIEQLFFMQFAKLTKDTLRNKSFDMQFSGQPDLVSTIAKSMPIDNSGGYITTCPELLIRQFQKKVI